MKEIPTLETERLVLRPFGLQDAADIQRLAGDRAIADTTFHIPHPYEDGMAEEWIFTHQDAFAQGQGVTFAITRKTDGSLIGAISPMSMVKGHQAELGSGYLAQSTWLRVLSPEFAKANSTPGNGQGKTPRLVTPGP